MKTDMFLNERQKEHYKKSSNGKQLFMPSFCNVHSHAFQYSLAGRCEKIRGDDSFWSWRQKMYEAVETFNPEKLKATASLLYLNMLKMGYSSVGEFHYLHHQKNGTAYEEKIAMSRALLEAAEETGIQITLLPVLYTYSGFNRQPLKGPQRAFYNDTDSYIELLDTLHRLIEAFPGASLGIAFHSLRAVSIQQINDVLQWRSQKLSNCPVHIHISEQMQEVTECLSKFKNRPVEYLCKHIPIDKNWTLIHATHLNTIEVDLISKSKAVVGLCPTTEANLGDGIFPILDFKDRDSHFALGSDSHVSLNPAEEMRLLEYGQRLLTQKRGVFCGKKESHPGKFLIDELLEGGRQSLQQDHGLISLNLESPLLHGLKEGELLDALIFSSDNWHVHDLFIKDKKIIAHGQHHKEEEIIADFLRLMKE